MYGTSQGDSESLKYSEEVFKNNLRHAIIGQLQNPPEGFEQVGFGPILTNIRVAIRNNK